MPDRENVIRGLECCSEGAEEIIRPRGCATCPYLDEFHCTRALTRDALELLKKQEEEIENLKQTAQSMMEGVCLLKEQEDLGTELTNAMELVRKKNERIKTLEEQIETLTRWRANAGAFD